MRHKYFNIFTILLFVSTIIVSIFSGFRDVWIGTDTENYTSFYNAILRGSSNYINYEPLFIIFSRIIASFELNSNFFLSLITLLITWMYLFAFIKSSKIWKKGYGLLPVYTIMLFSSWYLVATINGLRQGIALAILYVAMAFLADGKPFHFVIIFFLALGFHTSVILIIPFLFLYLISVKKLSYIYFSSTLLAITGLSEQCIKIISITFNLGVYEKIKDYGNASNVSEFYGYRIDIFIYSIFWVYFFIFSRHLLRKEYFHKFDLIIKNFIILSFPYLFFGFGGFSNRYAIIAWFYLPLIQAAFIVFSKFSERSKYLFFFVISPIALLNYISVVS